jgi:serine/threonine-protein kinase
MPDDGYQPRAADRFAPGSRIFRYCLEALIGRGGMAEVWRARDERLDRLVALKIIAPELAGNPESRRRFIREAQATAAVNDPHIIPVLEAGEDSGTLFIAMPLVEGSDAGTLVRQRGKLPPSQVAEIVSQVAAALDTAHANGLVHRDVKPANMLLAARRPGRPDHVYLSDFGLTKAARDSGLTGSGQFLGTADYVAPEQIEHRDVDGRADQYALGCSAFELLCGEPPFRRDHGQATLHAHQFERPPPLTSLRADLPAEVNDVFARVLAKSPAERYPACQDFANSLRSALGLQPYAGATGEGAREERTTGTEAPPTKQGRPAGIPATGGESAPGKAAEYAERKPRMGEQDKTRENRPLSGPERIRLFISLVTAFIGLIASLTNMPGYLKLWIAVPLFVICAILLAVSWDALKRAIKRYIWLVSLTVGAVAGVAVGVLVLSYGGHPIWTSAPTPTVNQAAYIGHIVEWANGSGQNTSWLVGSNGERYWIPNTSIFSCLRNERHTNLGPQSSTVLDDLPDSGKWASCPASVNRAAYIGHIVQWVNGGGQPNASWLVGSNGERYWIPNTSIFSCLKKEGHTDLGGQSSTVLDDLPDLGQQASCA